MVRRDVVTAAAPAHPQHDGAEADDEDSSGDAPMAHGDVTRGVARPNRDSDPTATTSPRLCMLACLSTHSFLHARQGDTRGGFKMAIRKQINE